jgi:glutamate-1-semialdehyde aminotransferase
MRLARHGAQSVSGVTPDLSTWGMAVGRVFAVSALAGKPELMEAEPQRGCAAGLPLVHQRRRDDRPASSGQQAEQATPCPGERVTDHAGTVAVMRPTGASAAGDQHKIIFVPVGLAFVCPSARSAEPALVRVIDLSPSVCQVPMS